MKAEMLVNVDENVLLFLNFLKLACFPITAPSVVMFGILLHFFLSSGCTFEWFYR